MMNSQSWFVKFVIWFMIFLMSVGFAALVITPFLGGSSLFGGDNGRSATQTQLEDARKDVRKHNCSEEGRKFTAALVTTCRVALFTVSQSYRTLATPDETATDFPKGYKQNLARAQEAVREAYELDKTDADTAQDYAAFLQSQNLAGEAIPVLLPLVAKAPKDEDLLLSLASAQTNANKLDDAIATYTTFIKRFPTSGQVDSIKEQITQLKDQQKQAAAQGAAGGGLGGNLSTSIG
jgi:tetratricopeptide (TPR) repeat protein